MKSAYQSVPRRARKGAKSARHFRLWSGSSAATLALAAALTAAPAAAQNAGAEEAVSDNTIVVTGTRIARPVGFDQPTPATVIGIELMQNLGQVNVSEAIKLIPQNSNFQTDATSGITAGANVGASYANLRGLNPYNGTRTLTLVNTRRFIPTSDGGAIDLNVIPSAMIERVETVTGGASAAYGSDAIAGVVNIFLKTKFEGLEAQADYGQTFHGDGETYHASLLGGKSFADGRGHLVASVEFQKNKGIGDCAKVRLWCAESYDIFTNSNNLIPGSTARSGYSIVGSPGYGLPHYIIGPGSKQAYNDPRGVIRDRAPAALAARNMRFNEAGDGVVQYDPGKYLNAAHIGARQGGDGASTYDDSDIQTPLERWVGYVFGEYELSDAITVQTELTYAKRKASNTSYIIGPRSSFEVNADNPFIPADLRSLLNGTGFTLGKDLDDTLTSDNKAKADVFRGLLGVKGDLFSDWTWEAYYQYGRNERRQDRTNVRVNAPFQFALQAVVDPRDPSKIICKELTKANPDPRALNCVPFNLFGLNNADPAALAYVYRPVHEDFLYTQHVLSGAVQGSVFEGWGAGPVAAAAGLDYRTESGIVTHGDTPEYNDYAYSFGMDYSGKIKVFEGFGELDVPVFRDSPIGRSFDVNGAVRYTNNHATNRDTGEEKKVEAVSWKVSGVYDVIPDLRFRASRSRDIRAAGFRELFLRNVPTEPGSVSGIVDNPALGQVPGGNDWTPILNGGSFSLKPEKADTTTAGVVLQPTFIPGLRFSADWYQIKIADAVTTLSAQRIVDFCDDYDLFCERITYGSAGLTDITFIDSRQVNLARMTVRGFDFEVDYRLPLSDIKTSLPGSLNLRLLANRQYDFLSKPNPEAPEINYAGQSGSVADGGDFNTSPPWLWSAFVTYDNEGFNTTLSWRRVSEGIYNVNRTGPEDEGFDPTKENSINTNRVKGASYFNIAMSYTIPYSGNGDQHVEIFGAIDNIFDRKPSVAPGGGSGAGSNYPTNPSFFDTFGARFRTGIRVTY